MKIYMTSGINAEIKRNENFAKFIHKSIKRYLAKDWGDICEEDKKMNNLDNERIVARYDNIYIITEWDRSYTTILFTHEY